MTVNVETLEKLERKITLTLPVGTIQSEVDSRLKKLARTVKMDGFRPGKVPMNVVAQRYGYSVHYEVMNDKVGEAFSQAANEAKLRVAGQPRITEKEESPEGELAFDAVFEVFPDVKINDLSGAEVEKLDAEVGDDAIDKTLDILRKQRRTFAQRAQDAAVPDGDRVTVDFEGKIDGEPFQGGKAEDFQFIVGEGQMLKEFEDAVRGLKSGDSRTFPLSFPADYHGKDVAGKQADFMVTVKKIEASHLPEVNEQLAKSLGIADATVEGLRADIKRNLEREVEVPPAGAQQERRDGRPDRQRRTRPAERPACRPKSTAWSKAPAPSSSSAASRTPTRRRSPTRCSARRPSAACAWAWWWPNWCAPTTCRPSPSRSRPTSTNWPPATRSRPTWCAGTSATTAAWPKSKRVVIENNVDRLRAGQGQGQRQVGVRSTN